MSLPSTPSLFTTQHNSAPPTIPQADDLVKSVGVYDTNSVRDRIRQWQQQGGGVIQVHDIGPEEIVNIISDGRVRKSKAKASPRTPSRKLEIEDTTETVTKSVADTRDPASPVRRSGVTPTKRVISDAHWRMKRSPPNYASDSQSEKKDASAWLQQDDGISVRPKSDLRPDKSKKTNSRRKSSNTPSSIEHDDSTCDLTPSGSSRLLNGTRQKRVPHQGGSSNGGLGCSRLSPYQTNDKATGDPNLGPPMRSGLSTAKESSPRHTCVSHSRQAESSPTLQRMNGMDSSRSDKGNLLSQVFGDSKKLFAKQTPEPVTSPRVPSIEAWLEMTPDPLVDAKESPFATIELLRSSRNQKSIDMQEAVLEDPNRIWEKLDIKEGTRRAISDSKKKRRVPSSAIFQDDPFPPDFNAMSGLSVGNDSETASKFVDLAQTTNQRTSTSLRRRTARKRVSPPLRDRLDVASPIKENDSVSVHSSQPSVSSVEEPDPSKPFRPPGLTVKRPFPSTGQHRLSTIASVETFNNRPKNDKAPSVHGAHRNVAPAERAREDVVMEETVDQLNSQSLKRSNSRLTKHADLISVLSLPRAGSKSIQSARSIRTSRARPESAKIEDLMQEVSTDESKYMRELQTLVDGVIPVLLSCVLSKSDSAVAAGLFQPSATLCEDMNFTRPIMDMGVALERLRTLHKRIPHEDPSAFLTWTHGAQRVYAEYLKAWRMGFQDVVVSLAPATETSTRGPHEGLEAGLPRDDNGDVINGDGERVDVAFLLKRPLVRLKYLAKTLKGINFIRPTPEAAGLASKYQVMVESARQRANEERARLEDETAAHIDVTRSRDPRTLAPLSGVVVDRTRRVRARDHFNLALQHSSGQCVDCRVELILRDEASNASDGGDLLICEIDASSRWLLFPPISSSLVSARNGDNEGEIIVMVRGFNGDGSRWEEVFSLRNEEEQTSFEWIQLLGLEPVPNAIARSKSFLSREKTQQLIAEAPPDALRSSVENSSTKSRTRSLREIDVPIGEQASEASKRWSSESAASKMVSSQPSGSVTSTDDERLNNTPSRATSNYVEQASDLRLLPSQMRVNQSASAEPVLPPLENFKEALGLGVTNEMTRLKRAKAKRVSKQLDSSPATPISEGLRNKNATNMSPPHDGEDDESITGHSVRTYGKEHTPPVRETDQDTLSDTQSRFGSPSVSCSEVRKAAVPSGELPFIPKSRKTSPAVAPSEGHPDPVLWSISAEATMTPEPKKLTKKRPTSSKDYRKGNKSRSATPDNSLPNAGEQSLVQSSSLNATPVKARRSSSPLKHEYEPSTASESHSDSDASTVERHESTSMTESSDEDDIEDGDVPTPLLPQGTISQTSKRLHESATSSAPEGTLQPSESVPQALYKNVASKPSRSAKTIASIYSWSDTGSWQSLHPDECSINITPGLIEAFEMSAAHSISKPLSASTPITDPDRFADDCSVVTSQNNNVQGERPLVALELTPLVPLRRGTALDISIRSPPTANSQIASGNNIMFRSRNPEECEALYALINHARIHNPTYMALQNARGPFAAGGAYPGVVGGRLSSKASTSRQSWLGGIGRSSSYRASSARTPSIAPTESSVGSMSSAFSALRRFGRGAGGGMFNIALSTITSRNGIGSATGSIYTSSDNSSGSGVATPIAPGMVANKDGSLGLKDAKIRLYIRETASRWRDMGSARLTILQAEKGTVGSDGRPAITGGYAQGMHEKRILVHGKTKGEVLLDTQLGEGCFERVARTGIAISVWEDVVGPNGEVGVVSAVGGVAGGRAKVYMIQMKSEAEIAYTFSLVGKLRY